MTGLTGGDGILCDAQSGNACAWRFARGGTEMIYLGMDSGANNNIALINRLSGTLYFSTNNTARLTIGAAGGFTIGDANDFTFNTTTGSKFGTATTQKLSFWNATPIVQPANTVAIDTLLVNTGLRATGAYANFDTTISPRAGTATANTAPLKFTSGTNLTAAEAGALEYNNDFFITDSSGARKSILGKLYNQTTSVTVANSVVETSLLTSTTTLPANFFSASKQIVLRLRGYHSAVSNPTIRIKVKLGSVVVLDTTAIVSGNSTNEYFDIDGVICCRTTGGTGTVMGQGFYLECGSGGNHFGMVNTSDVTIDTTTTQQLTDIFLSLNTTNNMIRITIDRPPLGISEIQEFKTTDDVAAFFFANMHKIPIPVYNLGTVTYDRGIYDNKHFDGIDLNDNHSATNTVVNSICADLRILNDVIPSGTNSITERRVGFLTKLLNKIKLLLNKIFH